MSKEYFMSKVNIHGPNGCWLWLGKPDPYGYGQIKANLWESRKAHRYSYYLFVDENFDKSLNVCHFCDNPPCVNPKHLWLGTNTDNHKDMVKKNRHFKIPKYFRGRAKLTKEQVIFIRNYPKKRGNIKKLALMFDVCPSTISMIITNKNWKELGK